MKKILYIVFLFLLISCVSEETANDKIQAYNSLTVQNGEITLRHYRINLIYESFDIDEQKFYSNESDSMYKGSDIKAFGKDLVCYSINKAYEIGKITEDEFNKIVEVEDKGFYEKHNGFKQGYAYAIYTTEEKYAILYVKSLESNENYYSKVKIAYRCQPNGTKKF